METKFPIRDKVQVKSSGCKRNHTNPSPSPSSLIEFGCSACFLCIVGPLSMVLCIAKFPFKIGWRAAKYAINSSTCCYCRSDKRISAEIYSSFSDIDFG
ncbi:hypothetical protein ERO13_A09G176300v2 [Gossypium hirsutum]|uniref:Uncharacterized protein n=2 Tax=Gossypium TaxID=3633 RepID=A0A5J5UH52_GOSBA|nr:hypothetical protein ES319_A09G185600v1 [Gossypium barbadense]KAG4184511.1 hypothetical protein ERO13_A09G176300v2 [Gossypium hirsutum]TYJ19406.1 hypothetical protein E1A91_A09G188700v1 [Gossypium mustelinum]